MPTPRKDISIHQCYHLLGFNFHLVMYGLLKHFIHTHEENNHNKRGERMKTEGDSDLEKAETVEAQWDEPLAQTAWIWKGG